MEAAQRAILSQIRKNEKARETLSQKQPPRAAQIAMVSSNLEALYIASSLISRALGREDSCDYSKEALEKARHTMESIIRRVEKVLPKFEKGTPQHTLAVRRIEANNFAIALMEAEYEKVL